MFVYLFCCLCLVFRLFHLHRVLFSFCRCVLLRCFVFPVARWSQISYMCSSWLCPTHPQHCNTCPLLGLLSEALPAPSTSQQWLRLRSLYAICAQRLHLFTRGVASLATLCSVVLGQRANQWAIGKSSWTCPGSTGRSSLGMATMQWGKN